MDRSVFHRPQKLTVYREKSATVDRLMLALAKAMAEFTPIVKDMTGKSIRKDLNGRLKEEEYQYASLESLHRSTKPALLKHGVVPMQEYCVSDEGVTLVTSLNYGDQFVSSTLPIRHHEDQQRQKAHASYMRRTAYEAILCLSAETDTDGAEAQPEAAAEAPVETPAADLWKQQDRLALKALEEAATPAAVQDIIAKVRKKIDGGDMDPHCLGRMETAGEERLKELRAQAKKTKPAEMEVAK